MNLWETIRQCRVFVWSKGPYLLAALMLGAGFGVQGGEAWAAQEETKKAATQQVGGLLFDVDEGVKIEQGPGGSVYLKSNRETMEQKFKDIEQRFEALEGRVKTLETALKPPASASEKESAEDSKDVKSGGRRVLIT